MSRLTAALIVIAAAAAALVATAPGAPADDVTLKLDRFYDPACRCYKLRFSGTISSGDANEYVAVLQQKCGSGFATAIAGGSTRAGGFWEAEVNGARPESDSSTYRARWKSHLSEPLVFRAKLQPWLTELGGGRYRVNVSTESTQQNMSGRIVELQRLAGGRWVRVQQAKLRGRGGTFTATVTARGQGRTFRILIPARSAAPCYVETTSNRWVAGRRAPGSTAVIDRTLLCSTALQAGLRLVEVGAASQTQQGPIQQEASVSLTTNWSPDWFLVLASSSSVQLNPTRCTGAGARVPLSAQGLRSGTVSGSDVEYECETPRRVLVRIRAVFAAPTKLEPGRPSGYPQLSALGDVREAFLAVRTQSGKPLAFASIESRRVRLFAAPSCLEDTTP